MANDSSQPLQSASEELLPELNCFFLSGARHDRDRIEIQIGFDGLIPATTKEFAYDVDCLVLCPKTLGLFEVETEETLRNEFQSYVRLHTHVSNPNDELSILRVKDRLEKMKGELNIETLRMLAIEFEGFLKGQIKRVLTRSETSSVFSSELETVHLLMIEFRAVLRARGLEGKNCDVYERGSANHDLLLLNEYLSHIYVQYLVEIYNACRNNPAAQQYLSQIEKYTKEESEIRGAYSYLMEHRHGPKSTQDEEGYPRRMSMLKKYFQKSLFVQVVGESLQKKALIPVYGISAALAASWAIMVQIYTANTVGQRIGINSIAFIVIAVSGYVAKDIMKDFFRKYFLQKSTMLFPDYEKSLFIKRFSKTRALGKIREYLRSYDSEKLPADLARYRYQRRGGELEEYLHEDILHFKKRVVLDLSALETKREFPWGMREILRYRFDRLLISMEDPYKNAHFLSKTGTSATRQAHRIYHVHMAVWIKHDNEVDPLHPTKPAFKAFKIVLDKTGILECIQLEKPIEGIPSVPG